MTLALERSLVALDVETHAKVPPERARIVELGYVMIFPDEREPVSRSTLINPGCPIEPGATEVHGITDADVADKPCFKDVAENIAGGLTNIDVCGYNVRFDLRVIESEMKRAGVTWSYADTHIIDALRLWQVAEPRRLEDAVRRWLNREPSDAHRAHGDAKDALDIAQAILSAHADKFPTRTARGIHEACFTRDPNQVDPDAKLVRHGKDIIITFGKHRGKPLRQVPVDYLQWILGADFSEAVKAEIRKHL